MGVFNDYIEKPVLSPDAEETTTKNRGKQRAEAEESSSFELLVLMKEMRKEMRRRDEQLKEELRWRDDNQATKNKKRKENLAALLQQRGEEWKEELAHKDRALRVELR